MKCESCGNVNCLVSGWINLCAVCLIDVLDYFAANLPEHFDNSIRYAEAQNRGNFQESINA